MTAGPLRDPGPEDAEAIARLALGRVPNGVTRFATGLRHFVYDISFPGGDAAVVRIGRADSSETIVGGAYWSRILRPRGVPLPEILHADHSRTQVPFPFMLLERFPGTDLGAVYPAMKPVERRTLAFQLAAIQDSVASLPEPRGYGFAASLEGPFQHQSWESAIAGQLARSRGRIERAGHFDPARAAAVSKAALGFGPYFQKVRPTPFLHDMTTKNVIVDVGELTGIVDVDDLCFGDPLFLPGLINMALIASGHERDYLDYWKEALSLSAHQERVLAFYTALFCVDFMGEIGQRFNRDKPQAFDPGYAARLDRTLADALSECSAA